MTPFRDRRDAGRQLAARLQQYAGRTDVVVLGLARGGVPVAFEVAQALKAPLDVAVVRKLGVPGQEELAMGAIASGGARVINDELMRQWSIPDEDLDRVEANERRVLERRERLFRGDREPVSLHEQTVLLVDDGLATGSTMRAAALAARSLGAKRVIAAVPVAAPDVCDRLRPEVDAAICLKEPNPFWAVGIWFDDFRPTTDDEVRALLRAAGGRPHASPPASNSSAPNASVEIIAAHLRAIVHCLDPAGKTLSHVAESVADARIVMIGDASPGTEEFHELRAELTKHLIAVHGFQAVAVEADWSDVEPIHRFVCGQDGAQTAEEALCGFQQFPRWTWRNTVVRDFVAWLRAFNDQLPAPARVGLFGLDLYDQNNSIAAIIDYLERVDPDAATHARDRYFSWELSGQSGDEHPHGEQDSRENDIVQLLVKRRTEEVARALEEARPSDVFSPALNARLARCAGDFYRALWRGGPASWSLRARGMADTFDAILAHLVQQERHGKVVVWEYGGPATMAELGGSRESSLGRLARQRHGNDVRIVGMSTYRGTVTTASAWDAPVECRPVFPGSPASYEALFHEVGEPSFVLMLRDQCAAADDLRQPWLRGALHLPGCESAIDSDHTRLADQFDVIIHLDETTALMPLDRPNG